MSNWKRPESVPYPSVWNTFERKGADGVMKQYWVQDLTPEYESIFLENMETVFLKDEPICKYSHFIHDKEAVKEFKRLWIESIKNKLALVCLTKNELGENEFVGGNMTTICRKNEKYDAANYNKTFANLLGLILYVQEYRDIFTEFNVAEYLTAVGLYTLPKFRGQAIATEILKARRPLCLAVGLPMSATVFTSIISQKNAKNAGFQDFTEIPYDDLEKVNPNWRLPGITAFTKTVKEMYIKYDK